MPSGGHGDDAELMGHLHDRGSDVGNDELAGRRRRRSVVAALRLQGPSADALPGSSSGGGGLRGHLRYRGYALLGPEAGGHAQRL